MPAYWQAGREKMSDVFSDILKKEASASTINAERYITGRAAKIKAANELAMQFSEGKRPKDIIAETATALGGIVGKNGKAVIIGADGQTSAGYMKIQTDTKKIHVIDKYTVVAGTGAVAFIQDIVKIFEADIKFIQYSKGDGTVISPNGKVNILSSLVRSIMALELYFGIGAGFLLGVYDPKDDEARLFHLDSFGAVTEKDIAAHGCGTPYIQAILEDRYEELGGKDMNQDNLARLMKRALKIAIKIDVFCGGKKLLYIVDKYEARSVR